MSCDMKMNERYGCYTYEPYTRSDNIISFTLSLIVDRSKLDQIYHKRRCLKNDSSVRN